MNGRKQPTYPPEAHATPNCNCIGKICSGCGQTKCLGFFHRFILSRDGYRSKCIECRKGEWLNDERRAKKKELYWRDHEATREYHKNWYRQNPERAREYRRNSYRKNIEAEKTYSAEYNRSDRGKQRYKRYYELHPEKNANRRNIERGSGTYTAQEWTELKETYNYTCLCCGKQEPDIKLTPDHVIPLTKGGSNTIDNIQPLCITCNKRKGTKKTDYR